MSKLGHYDYRREGKNMTAELRDKIADIIHDHAPIQNNRYLPEVVCATPACNFRGEYYKHSQHVTDLILKVMER